MVAPVDTDETVTELYRLHAVRLARAALLLLGDRTAAEDVVQEAFLGLHRRSLREGMPDDPIAYVQTSVLNGCRSQLRRRSLRVLWPVSPPVGSPESAVVLDEQRRLLQAAISRLPRRQREVLVLKYYLDLPEAEIAATLGVSRGTVASSASRALKVLGDRLGEEFA